MLKKISLLICLLFWAVSSHAAITVYTDPLAWEAAAGEHVHLYNFDSYPTGNLSTGVNFWGPLSINISGDPGFNAIDDSITPDPFSDTLSPNGSKYYLGHVETPVTVPSLVLVDLEYSIYAFGADWVTSGDLFMEFGGSSIFFGDYLTNGTGFLGIVADQGLGEFAEVNFSGSAVFGVDDVRTGAIPIPAAVWLFGFGLISLIGFARRKAA